MRFQGHRVNKDEITHEYNGFDFLEEGVVPLNY